MASGTAPPQIHAAALGAEARERVFGKVLAGLAAFIALTLVVHLIVVLWARHDFTPVEALVTLHSSMLARGEGLYWGLNRYPYTISAYGPIFYGASGILQSLGVPAYQSGRLISYAALLGSLWLCWHLLGYMTRRAVVRTTGVILAAASSNLLYWGTTGQVDMLGCCFSLAALTAFLKFREQRDRRALVLSGVFVVLAVFTKQTFIAAGAAIGLTLLWEDRKRAAFWIGGVAATGIAFALALNAITHGGYFADAILANMNPFALFKLGQQAQYLILTSAGLIIVAMAGVRGPLQHALPLYLYAAIASLIWLLTAPKIGSDLNYQVEMTIALALCAAASLDRLGFFSSLFTARRTWVTMLQLPLLVYLVVNFLLTVRVIAERAVLQTFKRDETAALAPYVGRPGRLLSMHYDSLVRGRGRIEVEPLIYSLLVDAGVTDPGPVLRDLASRQFATVILAEDLFGPPPSVRDPEGGRLPGVQEDAIRKHYRLVKHLDGPNRVYIYEPRRD